nr:hypothetical protein [Tanacetum cinerariifolium]
MKKSNNKDKCNEVCEEVENRGTGVNETNSDKEANLVQSTPDKNNVSEVPMNIVNSSYAKVLNKSLDNKLMLIPTKNGVDGIEVVIFDDEIVKEGSKKWELNVCDYFVGYKMSYQEHRYNLFRMWGKFGLKQIFPNGNGLFLFKFKSENGINDVIKSRPWMVNGKTMFMQKWDPSSTNGISAIASRLGNPLIMDQVTTNICNMGNGRAGFARVLIEVEACKGLLDQIEIVYRNSENMEIGRKFVKVEYDWKPSLCSFCLVFGHKDDNCGCRPKTVEEIEAANEELRKIEEDKKKEKEGKEEFTQVNRKKPLSAKQVGKKNGYMQGVKKDNVTYQPVKRKVDVEGSKGNSSVVQETKKVNNAVNESPSIRNKWNVNQLVMDSIRRSANKFSVLIDDPEEEGNDEDDNVVQNEEEDEGEVAPSSTNFMDVKIAAWNIRGLGKLSKQNVVKNLLNDEKLGVCVVLETKLKGPKVKRIRDIVFSRWSWLDNAHCCSKGCRIMVGWNNNKFKEETLADLSIYKTICNNNPWVVMGDMNVSLNLEDHSEDKEEFKTLVEGNWNIKVEGFAMYKLVKKLKAMKPIMNNLNWKNGNLCDKVKKLKSDLDPIQISIDNDPHNESLRRKGVDILGEYSVALENEEKLMFQRAKVQWFSNGSYSFVNHFKSFIGPQQDMKCLEMDSRIFKNKIELKSACDMIREVTREEIKYAMYSIDDNKAPGPDGYTVKFFKKAWNIVGNDVCRAVEEFFLSGKLLGELNATLITLVPKASTPTRVTDFRPIACCNVAYKCISKIITNRIKNVLDTIVNKIQSSFIPERQIIDYILLTQELLKGYDSAKDPKRCSMKIDIQKAYDTVYWASVFKLPKVVTKDIERIFKGFLWNQGELQKGKAKVSWKDVFQHKKYEGLGFKTLEQWNSALLVKHLWNVANKKDTLWVRWIHLIKLKGMSVWEIDKQSNDSCLWKSFVEYA